LLLVASPSVEGLFDASLKAHQNLSAATVTVSTNVRHPSERSAVRYDVQYARPDQLRMRMREQAMTGRSGSDRTYFVRGGRMTAYDAEAHERLARTFQPKGDLAERAVAVLGPVDDSVRIILSPTAMREFYAAFRGLSGWTRSEAGGLITVVRRTNVEGRRTTTSFAFERATHRLRLVQIALPDGQMSWTYTYGTSPRQPLQFEPPKDARSVAAFVVMPEPPKYADRRTEDLTRAMMRSLAAFTRGEVSLQDEEASRRIAIDGARFREEGTGFAWAFDGQTLTVRTGGQFYRGMARRRDVAEHLARIGVRPDPLMREFLLGRAPFRTVFTPDLVAKAEGFVEVGGAPSDILRLQGPRVRVTFFVRRDNRLPQSVTTESLDARGQTISTTTRRFAFRPGAPSGAFQIAPPAGARVLPLPPVTPR
jgi:outer membrane lipoprotein-sorting protein